MEKEQILREIQRLAAAYAGKAPGRQVFERETGIKQTEWYPHLWLRWSDALAEAGCAPNEFQSKLPDDTLLLKYAQLVRELGRIPLSGELRRKARIDPEFPSESVFARFGGKTKLLQAVLDFSQRNAEYSDVSAICDVASAAAQLGSRKVAQPKLITGFVYLMKSGHHYKIGRTNALGRRQWELGIKIPVPPRTVHVIETDDPIGVEAYWHKRFAEKRGEGEWFSLTPQDVAAFRRWKRIV